MLVGYSSYFRPVVPKFIQKTIFDPMARGCAIEYSLDAHNNT